MKSILKNKTLIASMLLVLSILASCKKEETNTNDQTPSNGAFKIEFEHVWGSNLEPFSLNQWYVHPMSKDSMKFTTLRYYISNVKLKNTKGEWLTIPESYYLVDASLTNGNIIEIKDVPSGDYTELSYMIGVDSLRNVSGAQGGALAPSNGMFWSWTTGYIMIKAEGESPNSSSGGFSFHLGGFSGANNIVALKSATFGSDVLTINANAKPVVHLLANPARFRHTLGSLSSGVTTIHMPSANAKISADDFTSWVRFDHLHK